jgi:hypothetical protein
MWVDKWVSVPLYWWQNKQASCRWWCRPAPWFWWTGTSPCWTTTGESLYVWMYVCMYVCMSMWRCVYIPCLNVRYTSSLHELLSARSGNGQQIESLGTNELDGSIGKARKSGENSSSFGHSFHTKSNIVNYKPFYHLTAPDSLIVGRLASVIRFSSAFSHKTG